MTYHQLETFKKDLINTVKIIWFLELHLLPAFLVDITLDLKTEEYVLSKSNDMYF